MNKGQWALTLEIVRHVEPFLGLSLDELKLLEGFHNASIRRQSFTGSLSAADLKVFTPESYDNAVRRLTDYQILLPTTKLDTFVVNLYGLIRFYLVLTGESSLRKTTADRFVRTERLLQSIQSDFKIECLPVIDLRVSIPELKPRQRIRVGRTKPILATLLKHRLIEACMSVAIDHLRTLSEFTVFMRCINMTLERDVITCPIFSIDRVRFGHAPRGSLGLPITARSIKTALRSLKDQGLLDITRPFARSKLGKLTINIAGITAVYARDHRNIRAYELFLTVCDLVKNLGVNLVLKADGILDTTISDIITKLPYTHRDLHREIHTALGTPPANVRVKGQWSDGSCPTAAETHIDGTDDDPSFGILIDEDGSILYNCWACQDGQVRPISHLFSRMAESSGFPHQAHRVCRSASKLVRMGAIQIPEFEQPEALDTTILAKYPLLTRYTKDGTGYLKKYLVSRGVSPDAYEHFRVRYLPSEGVKTTVPKTLITEFTNSDGTVVALRLRTLKSRGRLFTTIGSFGSSMFGLALADLNQPLLVVEGEIDAECCFSRGFKNVVAIGGATRKTSVLADVIRRWSNKKVYLGLDCDQTGQEAQDRLIKALESEVPDLYIVDWSEVPLPTPVHTETGVRSSCKDAGDIPTKEQFLRVIENARPVRSV